ncbi:MAG: AAA family ATPase [Bacteroidia bacterium]
MNPFQISGYVEEKYFCDRITETETLVSSLKNGRNTVVYGWRRLGKSALLHHVLAKLRKEKFVGIYADLYGTKNMQQAIETIAEALMQQGSSTAGIGKKLSQLLGRIGASISFDPFTAMPSLKFNLNTEAQSGEHNLTLLYEYLNENHKNVVVVLDEFQQITQYKHGHNPEAIFRSLMQRFPKIRFVFSGSHRGLMLSMFGDINRPFYKSCDMLLIDSIPLETYNEFAQKWMKYKGPGIESSLFENIYNWANGQTLYEKGKAISQETLNEVYTELINQESHYFQHINDLLTPKQSDVMIAIAKEQIVDSHTSNAFLSKHNLGSSGGVIRVLNSLESKALIIKTKEGYRIHDTLLSRWYEGF